MKNYNTNKKNITINYTVLHITLYITLHYKNNVCTIYFIRPLFFIVIN